MKKITYFFAVSLLLLFCSTQVSAQVSSYYFTQNLASYSAISGGTVFGTQTSDDDYFCNAGNPTLSQNTGPGIPIGFTFTFNATVYDCFGISNNGWIFFGQSTLTPNAVNGNSSSNYTGLSATSTAPAALQNRVAALARDLQAQTGSSLRVETVGSAPNRTCVIQWENYKKFGTTGVGDVFNFQIRLIETSNIVDVIYGSFLFGGTAAVAEVGLRGNANTDFNNRVVNTANSWSVSAPGTVNTNSANITAVLLPISGQAYRWLPSAVLCSGVPSTTALTTNSLICPGSSALLSMNNSYSSYTNTGITYQWYESTSSSGPFTAVTGATNTAFIANNIGVTSYYVVVPSCSVGPVSTTATPAQVNVGSPAAPTAISNVTLICPNTGVNLSLSLGYSGVNYQWQASTGSAVGPYTTIATATLSTYNPNGITANTWYQAIVTCSASASSSVASIASEIHIAATVIDNVPYYETFEGIVLNNQLPNCSWAASNPTTICQTYTTANANNRIPHTGQKFASFRNGTNPNGDYFYTNGIQLIAGITYSTATYYITDGGVGWSNFSLLYGSAQSSLGLTSIASLTGAVTGQFYQLLSGTFQVSTSGVYYIAIKCIGSLAPQYLSWDDLSVTIPCSENSPTLMVGGVPVGNVCAGVPMNLTASGADSYVWSTGSNLASTSFIPTGNGSYTVIGTSALSGCSATVIIPVNTNPSPAMGIIAMSSTICAGTSATLNAFGANTYTWSNGGNGPTKIVSPTSITSYTVIGENTYGCIGEASQTIVVNPRPTLTISSSPEHICPYESATLTANGALTYEWKANSLYLQANPVVVLPMVITAYTVTGTDANGCKNTSTYILNVEHCAGLNELNSGNTGMQIYPNPASDKIFITMQSTSMKTISLIDLSGRVISSISIENKTAEFNLNELATGVYFVKVQSAEGAGVIKFIKE